MAKIQWHLQGISQKLRQLIDSVAFFKKIYGASQWIFCGCIMLAIVARTANIVTSIYLAVFMYCIANTFNSIWLIRSIFVIAILSVLGHIIIAGAGDKHFTVNSTANEFLNAFGFYVKYGTKWKAFLNIGFDVFLVVSTAMFMTYISSPRQMSPRSQRLHQFRRAVSSLPGAMYVGRFLQKYPQIAQFFPRIEKGNATGIFFMLAELVIASLLFIASFAAPSVLSAIYYLILVQRLVSWTFFSPEVILIRQGSLRSMYGYFLDKKAVQYMLWYTALIVLLL